MVHSVYCAQCIWCTVYMQQPVTHIIYETPSKDPHILGCCEVREKTNKMQQLDVYYQHFLNMFRASLCQSSGNQDVCVVTYVLVS